MTIARVTVTSLTGQGSETKKYNCNLNDSDIWADIRVLFVHKQFNGYITVPGVGFKQVVGGQYANT